MSDKFYRDESQGRASLNAPCDKNVDLLGNDLREAIRHMVVNISKSFIVEWYTSISPTNHDFVASCETLIENALLRFAELCIKKLDKYKVGQLITSLLHDHILNDNISEKNQSIESQIDNHEYDICQSSVVRIFGLLSSDDIRRVIFTDIPRVPKGEDQFNAQRNSSFCQDDTKNTSALYTLVIAMLTKAVFMPIVDSISTPDWLYAVIIWLCKRDEKDRQAKQRGMIDGKIEIPARNTSQLKQFTDHVETNFQVNQQKPLVTVTTTRGYRSLDLEEGIDISSGNINFENPVCDSLKRPLDNIEIYATEEVKSNNSCYVLYCIRYDGLCYRHPSAGYNFMHENPNVPIIDKRATTSGNRRQFRNEPSSSSAMYHPEVSSGKSFRRRMTIKRRFREFVILQLRLEENPKIRPYMKNIPKPTKLKAATQSIFSLPGITNIKLDQSTIKLRQRFLERFLIALNSSPFIANSYEFKEFFSFNLNTPSINMSKSKSLILQVNLNKVFVDSLRSALSIIRATIPSDEYNLGSNPDPDAWLIELQQRTMKLHVQTRTSHSKMNLERLIDSKLLSMDSCVSSSERGSSRRKSSIHQSSISSPSGSLGKNMVKSHSSISNTNSSYLHSSRSSSSNSQHIPSDSRSSSSESIYHDATSGSIPDQKTSAHLEDNSNSSIQICDTVPIASKIIEIVHYSMMQDVSSCSNSPLSFMARLLLGKSIERQVTRLLEKAFTLETATLCINGITSSIWDEGEDSTLDMENASLDEALKHLTNLLEQNCSRYSYIPNQIMKSLIGRQSRFYLSQLASQKRNKFVIYSFFVHLLDELEITE